MTKVRVTAETIRKSCSRGNFRSLFPEYKELFNNFIRKPGCGNCFSELLDALMGHPDRLTQYFGDVDFDIQQQERFDPVGSHNYTVINCSIHELEDHLNRLPAMGAYQISVARYEDQVTAIVNRID